jgi:hypothetical protein
MIASKKEKFHVESVHELNVYLNERLVRIEGKTKEDAWSIVNHLVEKFGKNAVMVIDTNSVACQGFTFGSFMLLSNILTVLIL